MDNVPFPNAEKVGDFIESEPDLVTRSLMRLVYGQFLGAIINKDPKPDGAVDMLYCFRMLRAAFQRKDALANALKGDYGNPFKGIDETEWT